MATLGQMIPRIFRQAWRRYGQPSVLAVRPIADWNLPAGFAYSADVDAIVNGAGTVLPNPDSYWVTDVVYVVPSRSARSGDVAELQQMLVHGLAISGSIGMWVLGDDILKLRVAHQIKLGDQWYDLESEQQQPSGYPDTTGLWAYVRLRGRS